MKDNYSNIKLEQYVLNELSDEETHALERAVKENESLRKRIDAIRQSNTEISASIDESAILRDINYRIKNNSIRQEQNKEIQKQNKASSWGRLAYAMPILAIVAVSTFMLKENMPVSPGTGLGTSGFGTSGIEVTEDGIRFKGLEPHINIYQQIEGGSKLIENHATLHEGDSLQLSYIAAGQQFGAIFSIDGNDVVTQHFPLDDQSSTNSSEKKSPKKLMASGEFMMKRSYQLDDAPKYEHFFFISSKSTFNLQEIIELAQNSVNIAHENTKSISELPDTLSQFVITINKAEQ